MRRTNCKNRQTCRNIMPDDVGCAKVSIEINKGKKCGRFSLFTY